MQPCGYFRLQGQILTSLSRFDPARVCLAKGWQAAGANTSPGARQDRVAFALFDWADANTGGHSVDLLVAPAIDWLDHAAGDDANNVRAGYRTPRSRWVGAADSIAGLMVVTPTGDSAGGGSILGGYHESEREHLGEFGPHPTGRSAPRGFGIGICGCIEASLRDGDAEPHLDPRQSRIVLLKSREDPNVSVRPA